jgi:hypothetical protein
MPLDNMKGMIALSLFAMFLKTKKDLRFRTFKSLVSVYGNHFKSKIVDFFLRSKQNFRSILTKEKLRLERS